MSSRTTSRLATLLSLPVGLLFLTGVTTPAEAANFFPASGTYTVDTTALTLTGPGTAVTGVAVDGVAVFSFESVYIPSGVLLSVSGGRPFQLVATDTLTVGGVIDGNGTSATDFTSGAAPGGPGGGAGGAAGAAGGGPGGGGVAVDPNDGSGGGGFGGVGARGATAVTSGGGGGAAYGSLTASLQGGSGGGGSQTAAVTGGGGGGGAVALVGDEVTVAAGGLVRVDGGGGATGGGGASGGGSGGGLVLRADSVQVDGTVSAAGGAGGAGGCCGDGGGGSGGRISYLYDNELVVTGSVSVAGGLSGSRSTGGCCGHGTVSPDASGAAGVVSNVHASRLTPGSSKTVDLGKSLTLSTRLTDTSAGQPLAGEQVGLYRRAPAGSWSLVANRTTTTDGVAKLKVKPTARTDYRWQYAGNEAHQPVDSAVQTIRVAQVVAVHVTSSNVARGASYIVYGTVRPAHAGDKVLLQRKTGSGWAKVAKAKVKRQHLPGGTTVGYRFGQRGGSAGTFRYRVVRPATGRLEQGVSGTVTVRVH
jgi:5-hydroxyisourate hydrolase-like protein (transthyretin family)